MKLYLMRHAKSNHSPSWKSDSERPLSKTGIKIQEKVAKGLLKLNIQYREVWISPFIRAKQTYEIIQSVRENKIEPREIAQLQVWGDPKKVCVLIEEAFKQNPRNEILLVGHNPNMTDLLHLLVEEDNVYMSESDLVIIEFQKKNIKLKKYHTWKELVVLGEQQG